MAPVKAMALNIGSKKMCKQKKNSVSLIVFLNIIQGTGTLCKACSFPLKPSRFLKVNLKDSPLASKITLEYIFGLLSRKPKL